MSLYIQSKLLCICVRQARDIFATVQLPTTSLIALRYGVIGAPMLTHSHLPVLQQPAYEPVVLGAKTPENKSFLGPA